MSKYCQQLKDNYKLLTLGSPEEMLICKSSHYVDLLLVNFDRKLNRYRDKFVSGQFNFMMKSTPLPSQDTRPYIIYVAAQITI